MRDKIDKARNVTVTKSHLLWANIPFRYWHSTVQKASTEACVFLKKFLPGLDNHINSGFGLWIQGTYETGKSSLAAIIAKEVIRHGGVVTFIPMIRLMEYLTRDTCVAGQTETILERVARSNLVILDDVGAENYSSNVNGAACLEGLLRQLYDNLTSTIFTTNLTAATVKHQYKSGIGTMFSRLVKQQVVLKTLVKSNQSTE